jgi:hypothetical protein
MLNGLATFASAMPFHDRFFIWSWTMGPMLIVYSISFAKYTLGGRKMRPSN